GGFESSVSLRARRAASGHSTPTRERLEGRTGRSAGIGARTRKRGANRNYDALRRRLPSTIAALRARPARRARLSGEPRKRSRNSASVIATSASGGGGGVAGAVCRAGGA